MFAELEEPQALAALMLYLFQAASANNSPPVDSRRPVDALEQPHGSSSWFKGVIPTHDRITSCAAGENAHARYNKKAISS